MNPLDIHLKFPDEATATTLLFETGVWGQSTDENNNARYFDAPGYLTDVIGLIHKPTGTMLTNEEGIEYPEMTNVGGWHVNMRGQLPKELEQYKVIVSGIPHRIWD